MRKPNITLQTITVERFKDHFPIGSKVNYRVDTNSPHQELTTRTEAFISNGMAVVFFEEKSGYYDISAKFVKYPK